jgi:NADH-quinone oxidoreductase subunit N
VVGAFYYLRVIKTMYFDEPDNEFAAIPGELGAVMGITGFLVVSYFLTVGRPLVDAAHTAALSLF